MALGSGLAAQIGYGVETTSGTPVAPTFYVPFVSETLTEDRARIKSNGIIAGRRVRTSGQWGEGNITVGGNVSHELPKRGVGKLFAAWFGGTPNTTGSGPYTHTFTPGDLGNKSLTIQKGIPGTNGTVYPINFTGMKANSWEIAASAGEIVTFDTEWVGMRSFGHRSVADGVTTSGQSAITSATAAFSAADIGTPISGTGIPAASFIRTVTSATAATIGDASGNSVNATASGTGVTFTIGIALGSATYATGVDDAYYFVDAFLTLGGTANAVVKSFTIGGNNGLDADRRGLGRQGTTAEPLEAAHREYTGTMEVEFDGLTNYNRYRNATEVACVATFQSGTDSITLTMNVALNGETPQAAGTGIVTMNVPFEAFASGADTTAITAVIVNGDTTP